MDTEVLPKLRQKIRQVKDQEEYPSSGYESSDEKTPAPATYEKTPAPATDEKTPAPATYENTPALATDEQNTPALAASSLANMLSENDKAETVKRLQKLIDTLPAFDNNPLVLTEIAAKFDRNRPPLTQAEHDATKSAASANRGQPKYSVMPRKVFENMITWGFALDPKMSNTKMLRDIADAARITTYKTVTTRVSW
ncbi:hypothetical protein DVH05_024600 [Phytophthora capsici]|nr:hypothetical protein DVH05_024600 [Phytophthora capsici]|eukprot:jgi/Phyca11/21067/fgenesh1_pg.PHYCAscaffold_80_\